MAQRRLDGSYHQIQTEINQVDSGQRKHQIAANDDAGVQQVIDQIEQREIGGIVVVDKNNLGGLVIGLSRRFCLGDEGKWGPGAGTFDTLLAFPFS